MGSAALPPVAAVLVFGCQATPPEDVAELSDVPVAPDWTAQEAAAEGSLTGWVKALGDGRLEALVSEALVESYDLRVALARVDAAAADLRVAGAQPLPQVNGSFGATRQRRAIQSTFGPLDSISNAYNLGLSATWELDVWGRLRDQISAAIGAFQASEADFLATRLSIAGMVASAYYDAVAAYEQLELARQTRESFLRSFNVVEGRFREGLASGLDVRLARANMANAEAAVMAREAALDTALRRLETLLGRYPAKELEVASELPALPGPVPAGLPSELLERRPDIVAAERRLAAAQERLGATEKLWFPSFSLTGSLGTASEELGDLADGDFRVWSIGGNLLQPIFQAGRIEGQIDRAEAQRNEALANYGRVALTAFREVETALANEQYILERREAVATAERESVAAEDLALERYTNGLEQLITVLEAQRRSFNAQSERISVANQLLQNRIDLYLALGGDVLPTDEETAIIGVEANPVDETGRTPDPE